MFRRRRWQIEKKSGIVNLAKIRKEIGYLAHAQYDGIFGSDLEKNSKRKKLFIYR